MAWETITKKVRGIAQILPSVVADHSLRDVALTVEGGTLRVDRVYVRFVKSEYDPRAGKEIHGKMYDSPEEAIEELGANIVERVLRKEEDIPVTVSISLPKWVEA